MTGHPYANYDSETDDQLSPSKTPISAADAEAAELHWLIHGDAWPYG